MVKRSNIVFFTLTVCLFHTLIIDCFSLKGNAIDCIHLLNVSILSFELTDLWPWFLHVYGSWP